MRIKSPDPLVPPATQFNFLAGDYDFQALIYGGLRHADPPVNTKAAAWSDRRG